MNSATIFFALTAVVASAVAVSSVGHDLHARPQYKYSYGVSDKLTGDQKNAAEVRDGEVTRGSYSLVQPDGVLRTVNYIVTPHGGFQAQVVNKGVAGHPAIYGGGRGIGLGGGLGGAGLGLGGGLGRAGLGLGGGLGGAGLGVGGGLGGARSVVGGLGAPVAGGLGGGYGGAGLGLGGLGGGLGGAGLGLGGLGGIGGAGLGLGGGLGGAGLGLGGAGLGGLGGAGLGVSGWGWGRGIGGGLSG